MYSLPEGADPEETWKYHTQVHAPDIKKLSGDKLKKYVVNRVDNVIVGGQQIFAIMENWYENKEDIAEIDKRYKITKAASGKTLQEDFNSHTTNRFRAIVEEKEII